MAKAVPVSPDAIAEIYASEIVSGFDIHKPEKLNDLFMRYDDQGLSYFQLLRSMGFEKQVALDTYGHFEENRIHERAKVRANVAQPAAGADIVFVLDTDAMDANNNFYPRLYDTLLFSNRVTGYIQDIDVSTPADPSITVRLNDENDQFPALTAGDFIPIISSGFSEGSGQPEGAIRGAWEYDNDAQIIKETIGATGTEMVNQTWFKVTSDGKSIPAYYYLGQVDLDYRMALKIDGALLFQKRTTYVSRSGTEPVDPVTNRQIYTTEGLFPYIERVGNTLSYTIGSFDISDFDDANLILDREFAGNHIMFLLGIQIMGEVEDTLKLYFADTNIQYARQRANDAIFNKNESLGASVNFKYFTKNERTYMLKRFGNLSNSNTVGGWADVAGYYSGYTQNWPSTGVLLPLNKRKDPRSNKLVESVGCRYRALGRYNRRMEVWSVGGAGEGLKVTEFDKRDTYMRSHIGAHHRGGNQMIWLQPS